MFRAGRCVGMPFKGCRRWWCGRNLAFGEAAAIVEDSEQSEDEGKREVC